MNNPEHHSFRRSLSVQMRIIQALIRREYITLSGKSGMGFLILFGEPFMIMLFVMIIIAHNRLHAKLSFPIYDFVLSGWGIMWLCRYPLQRMGGAILGNASFLYHRNIKILDILISRSFLMLSASVVSFVLIFILYLLIVPSIEIYQPLYIALSLFYTCWYTLCICIIFGGLAGYSSLGDKFPILIAIIHVFISGSFFMVAWLPPNMQRIALLSPLIDMTEIMRYGFFGDRVPCMFDIPYITMANLALTFIALRLTYVLSKTKNVILEM